MNRDAILDGLIAVSPQGGKGEGIPADELPRRTLLVPAHLNALEPDVLLVIGGRGAGKTHLFRLINLAATDRRIDLGAFRPALAGATWVCAFSVRPPQDRAVAILPDELGLQLFAAGRTRTDLIALWWGLLLGVVMVQGDLALQDLLKAPLPAPLAEALTQHLKQPDLWHPLVLKHSDAVQEAFDQLDAALTREGRYLFATYDDLDVMAIDWEVKRALIQALLQLWTNKWRRFRRIRPKIFLRRDLFAPAFLQFPDSSKLAGNMLELRWTPNQLYQLVFQIWASQNGASFHYVEEHGRFALLQDADHGVRFRSAPRTDELRAVIHGMLGEFMGSNAKRGRSFDWFPNHLQDALGEIFPRSFLNLFSFAARDEAEHHRAAAGRLLAPESVAVAIEQVSQRRITELTEEYPWLARIKDQLQGERVPMTRAAMRQVLAQVAWDSALGSPPQQDPDQLIETLLQLGIFRLTQERSAAEEPRIHVPDVYLFGFGLKRQGGIRRPQQ